MAEKRKEGTSSELTTLHRAYRQLYRTITLSDASSSFAPSDKDAAYWSSVTTSTEEIQRQLEGLQLEAGPEDSEQNYRDQQQHQQQQLGGRLLRDHGVFVRELRRVSLLWDEEWAAAVGHLGSGLQSRLRTIASDIRRLNRNRGLGHAERAALVRRRFDAVFQPVPSPCASSSGPPSTCSGTTTTPPVIAEPTATATAMATATATTTTTKLLPRK